MTRICPRSRLATGAQRPPAAALAAWGILLTIFLLTGCRSAGPGETLVYAPTSAPLATSCPTEVAGPLRSPAVAGAYYPGDPDELRQVVDGYLEDLAPTEGRPLALIVPHAGYVYSAPVAAHAYAELLGQQYDAVVLIGPNHQARGLTAVAVYAEGAWETPLGAVPVDTELAQAILRANPAFVDDPELHAQEHSLEVQLPFLQRVLPGTPIVPIMIGRPTPENVQALSEALLQVLPGRDALLIASSDLSHYPPYEQAVQVDGTLLEAIETLDSEAFRQAIAEAMAQEVPNLVTPCCGEGSIAVLLEAGPGLGVDRVRVLRYANSGDVPQGDRSQVVGYAAVKFWRDGSSVPTDHSPSPTVFEEENMIEQGPLTETERVELLELARQTIAAYLQRREVLPYQTDNPHLLREGGIFVTLNLEGMLRGCIGYITSEDPLYQTVQRAAVAAATQDPRFPPLTLQELPSVTIEISILSPMQLVEDVEEIEVGKHGLLIKRGMYQGLLLPQVAPEQGWDREQFLVGICRKAGLPADAWSDPETRLYAFTAEVFGEGE
ncbi:MAG: AmmeMemoRadiSam system protein B [Chloroflexia bacterium]|nr:AmmeMemoRadiSam system protein B [Chloroflexia bacterium]